MIRGVFFLGGVIGSGLHTLGTLTKLTQEQADYIGVPVEGPYKADRYRY